MIRASPSPRPGVERGAHASMRYGTAHDLHGVATSDPPNRVGPYGRLRGRSTRGCSFNGGGLGPVGGGRGDPEWLAVELAIVVAVDQKSWGVGFLSWSVSPEVVEQALEHRPHAVMLSFGDPRPLAEPVLAAGVRLVIQVTNLYEAAMAVELAADVIVAQGAEAGGHAGSRATLPFVPVVADLASPTPVLAAGGIADGRGIAAAFALGTAGVLMGTRFQPSAEALVDLQVTKAIIEGRGEDTERSRILDTGCTVASAISRSHAAQRLPRSVARQGSRGRSRPGRQHRLPRGGGPG